MRKYLLAVACATALGGCTTRIVAPDYDVSLLKRCSEVPRLAGVDGKSVILWSQVAGPDIVECVRNHNALVKIIENSE